jgi:hypothetical protein
VNLHVLRGARIVPVGGGVPFAAFLEGNILSPSWRLPEPLPRTVAAWSGWSDDAESGVGTWGPRGRTGFRAACERLEPALRLAGAAMLLRPGALHVLSDAPSCAEFLRTRADSRLGLLLDPASMLTPSLLTRAEEHVERILALPGLGGVGGVVLANVEAEDVTDAAVRLSPITRGVLRPGFLADQARRALPAGTPIVLLEADLEAQLSWLG